MGLYTHKATLIAADNTVIGDIEIPLGYSEYPQMIRIKNSYFISGGYEIYDESYAKYREVFRGVKVIYDLNESDITKCYTSPEKFLSFVKG